MSSPSTEDSLSRRSLRFTRGSGSIIYPTTNPFENDAPWTAYEYRKAVIVGCTLFPIRLLVALSSQLCQALIARLVTIGAPLENHDGCLCHSKPFGTARSLVRYLFVITNRLFLWSLGFWHIRVLDHRKDKRAKTNILVTAPHMNLTDPFIVAAAFPPWVSGVGKSDVLQTPIVCHSGAAGEGVFVDRKNPASRHSCKEAIARRADPSWGGLPLMIFPEGTTTNGRMLIQFKLGPFSPGQPVLPVLLRYNSRHYDFTWVGKNSNMGMCILRMMLQFANYCTVEILDQYTPSEEEIKDPILFANNVRTLMASKLGVPTTEHSYDDMWFSADAQKAHISQDFELCKLKDLYALNLDELKVILKRFKDIDSNRSGTISRSEFAQALSLSSDRSEASLDQFFSFFDTDGSGHISYLEFVQGVALLSDKCSWDSKAKLAFLIHDVEGNGRVNIDRLRMSLDKALGASTSHGDEAPSHKVLSQSAVGNTADLDFDAFCELLKKDPELLEATLDATKARLGITFDDATAEAERLRAEKENKKSK